MEIKHRLKIHTAVHTLMWAAMTTDGRVLRMRDSGDRDFRAGGVFSGQELNESECNVQTREIVLAFISGPLLCQSVSSEPMKQPL